MGWRTAILIWCCALVLAVLAAWRSGFGEGFTTRADGGASGLSLVPDQEMIIDAIELDRDGVHWRFERGDDGWVQVEPFAHPVNPLILVDLIDRVMALDVLDVISADDHGALGSLAVIGLDPPLVRLVLESGATRWPVEFGRRGIAGRGWIRRADGSILVAQGDLHAVLLDQDPTSWRDLRLFPGTTIDIDRIERTVSGETMVIERFGRTWRITQPLSTRADVEMVLQHVGEIAGVTAASVLLDEPVDAGAFGLDPPMGRVSVHGPGSVRTLRIGDRLGGTSQDRYAMVEGIPSVVQLRERDVLRLLGDPTPLVARTATGAEPMDVHGIRVRSAGVELLLERRLDEWIAPEFGDAPAAGGTVEHLLDLLSRTKASEITLVERYPLELEVATITLLDRAGGPIDTVRVLLEPPDPTGVRRWGLENGDRVVRILPEGLSVPISPADYAVVGSTP